MSDFNEIPEWVSPRGSGIGANGEDSNATQQSDFVSDLFETLHSQGFTERQQPNATEQKEASPSVIHDVNSLRKWKSDTRVLTILYALVIVPVLWALISFGSCTYHKTRNLSTIDKSYPRVYHDINYIQIAGGINKEREKPDYSYNAPPVPIDLIEGRRDE